MSNTSPGLSIEKFEKTIPRLRHSIFKKISFETLDGWYLVAEQLFVPGFGNLSGDELVHFENGKISNQDGQPSIIYYIREKSRYYSTYSIEYLKDNMMHREDGPAKFYGVDLEFFKTHDKSFTVKINKAFYLDDRLKPYYLRDKGYDFAGFNRELKKNKLKDLIAQIDED